MNINTWISAAHIHDPERRMHMLAAIKAGLIASGDAEDGSHMLPDHNTRYLRLNEDGEFHYSMITPSDPVCTVEEYAEMFNINLVRGYDDTIPGNIYWCNSTGIQDGWLVLKTANGECLYIDLEQNLSGFAGGFSNSLFKNWRDATAEEIYAFNRNFQKFQLAYGRVNELERKWDAARTERDIAVTERDEARKSAEESVDKLIVVKSERDAALNDVDELRESLVRSREANVKLGDDIRRMTREIANYRQGIADYEGIVESLRQDVADVTDAGTAIRDGLQKSLKEKDQEIRELQERLAEALRRPKIFRTMFG